MVITDPEADPYACSHDGGSYYKCGYRLVWHIFSIMMANLVILSFRFSDVDAFAKVQYSSPMHKEDEGF